MSHMFEDCGFLQEIDLSNFNAENVTKTDYMFKGCYSLTTLDLSTFNSKKLKSLNRMFAMCGRLYEINFTNFHTQKRNPDGLVVPVLPLAGANRSHSLQHSKRDEYEWDV